MDDVFARQAGDVRAGSANVFAIDDCDPFSFASKRPRSNGRTRAYPSSAFSALGRDAVCVEEFFDRRGNFDDVGLYRKMSGIEKLDLCVW